MVIKLPNYRLQLYPLGLVLESTSDLAINSCGDSSAVSTNIVWWVWLFKDLQLCDNDCTCHDIIFDFHSELCVIQVVIRGLPLITYAFFPDF